MTMLIPQLLVYLLLGYLCGLVIDYFSMTLPYNMIGKGPVCIECENDYSLKEYLLFKNCPTCSKNKNKFRLIIIILSLVFSYVLWRIDTQPGMFFLALLVFTYLGVICIIDVRYRAIFISTNIFGMVLCFIAGSLLFGITDSLIGGVANTTAFLMFSLFAAIFRKTKFSKKKLPTTDEPDLGIGDIIFAGVLGFLLGWPNILTMISITMMIGGLYAIGYQIIAKVKLGTKEVIFPFAPFMIGGTIITFIIVM